MTPEEEAARINTLLNPEGRSTPSKTNTGSNSPIPPWFAGKPKPKIKPEETLVQATNRIKKEGADKAEQDAVRMLQVVKPHIDKGLSDRVQNYNNTEVRERDPIGWTKNTAILAIVGTLCTCFVLYLGLTGLDLRFETKTRKTLSNWIYED